MNDITFTYFNVEITFLRNKNYAKTIFGSIANLRWSFKSPSSHPRPFHTWTGCNFNVIFILLDGCLSHDIEISTWNLGRDANPRFETLILDGLKQAVFYFLKAKTYSFWLSKRWKVTYLSRTKRALKVNEHQVPIVLSNQNSQPHCLNKPK